MIRIILLLSITFNVYARQIRIESVVKDTNGIIVMLTNIGNAGGFYDWCIGNPKCTVYASDAFLAFGIQRNDMYPSKKPYILHIKYRCVKVIKLLRNEIKIPGLINVKHINYNTHDDIKC
jgi:hypothetical protein